MKVVAASSRRFKSRFAGWKSVPLSGQFIQDKSAVLNLIPTVLSRNAYRAALQLMLTTYCAPPPQPRMGSHAGAWERENNRVFIFEFKVVDVDQTPGTALEQIRRKGYPDE